MRKLVSLSLILLLIAAVPPTAFGANGSNSDNPCSCTFWNPTSSTGELHAMQVLLEADTTVTSEDNYFLKLVDRQGHPVYYIKLTIPEEGKNDIRIRFEPPLKANQPYMAVLFSPTKNVKMTSLKVTGKVDDQEYVYFDHGCTGITIGPAGCKYMELH